MSINRDLAPGVLNAANEYPVIALVGPRQSGKTTLAQSVFTDHKYLSLEDGDILNLAQSDPRRFLSEMPSETGLIIDEAQHAPELLSYIQTIVDREKKNGFYIITGSQNLLVNQAITQSLAGRVAMFTLLPFSMREIDNAGLLPNKITNTIFKGFYPKLYKSTIDINRHYKNYIHSYVERDVRQIKNIADLSTFQKFIRLCASRIGQVLNLVSLGNDCGISHSTAQAWISVLEATYILFRLQPYFNNFGKRLIKSPKLYFYDTGLACSLLKIDSAADLETSSMYGHLVENLIIADFIKQRENKELTPDLYFWRDQTGHEIDCVLDKTDNPIPIEIKAGTTVNTDFFKGIDFWKKKSGNTDTPSFVVYGGDEDLDWNKAQLISWRSAARFFDKKV